MLGKTFKGMTDEILEWQTRELLARAICRDGRAADLQAALRPARGANHPVKDLLTGKIEITWQNHGFAVLGPDGEGTVPGDEPVRWETDFGAAQLSHINLYDRTVEGLTLLDVPGATVQYHPEAGPGPNDSLYLFDRFLDQISSNGHEADRPHTTERRQREGGRRIPLTRSEQAERRRRGLPRNARTRRRPRRPARGRSLPATRPG